MNQSLATEALSRIQEALERAVEVLKPFSSGSIEAHVKGGDELVTEADLAVNRVLQDALPRDGEGWLSEETADDGSRLESDNVWIVDPLDGTREFVAGIPEWCVSIAFIHRGIAIAGGITNPATHETFLGAVGYGVTYNGKKTHATSRNTLEGANVLASRSEIARGEWEPFRNTSFAVTPMGSVAYKLARVAAGLADVTWTLTPKHEWDVAAGVALMLSSSGYIRTTGGHSLVFNGRLPVFPGLLACAPGLRDEILALLGASLPSIQAG